MKCNVEYIGKLRSGKPQYFCTTHKSLSCDEKGEKLDVCLSNIKESFTNVFDLNKDNITSLVLVYENILTNQIPNIYINDKLHTGVFKYNEEILTYKDFTGILLARINNIKLEQEVCKRCHKYHSDNGLFAYTPHLIHFCNFCGHKFRAKHANISHELDIAFDIPSIKTSNQEIKVTGNCDLKYDVFKGILLINEMIGNTVNINDKKLSILEFLNECLKKEY